MNTQRALYAFRWYDLKPGHVVQRTARQAIEVAIKVGWCPPEGILHVSDASKFLAGQGLVEVTNQQEGVGS